MPTLDDFGGGSGEDPPQIQKQGRILVAHGEQTRVAGWYGPTNRDCMGFVTSRDSHEHRIRALDAYAISDDALDKMRAVDVGVVLIVEEDTDTVFEYAFEDFWKYGDQVPDTFLSQSNDPQTYVERDASYREWANHRDLVYAPRDADTGWDA